MKRYIIIMMAIVCMLSLLCSCSPAAGNDADDADENERLCGIWLTDSKDKTTTLTYKQNDTSLDTLTVVYTSEDEDDEDAEKTLDYIDENGMYEINSLTGIETDGKTAFTMDCSYEAKEEYVLVTPLVSDDNGRITALEGVWYDKSADPVVYYPQKTAADDDDKINRFIIRLK